MTQTLEKSSGWRAAVTDIRFWIIIFFIGRLYGIWFPPLEVGHNWRQTDGMMIARNFFEHNANIFFPTVDVAGNKSGIVGCEFPVLNYLVYLTSLLFGFQHWYGRLIVLIASSFGTWFFFRLIKNHFGEPAAFNSTIILLSSLWLSYSRKNIPDAFAASLCMVGLFYAIEYLSTGKKSYVAIFFISALLGTLSKITTATILTVLIIPLLDKHLLLTRKFVLGVTGVIILSSVIGWYFFWVPYLNVTYGFGDHFFMGMSYTDGITAIANNFGAVAKRFYDTPMKYSGTLALVAGIYLAIRKKAYLPLMCFAIPFVSFMILLPKTGASVAGDKYYVITLIPCMAFMAGYGLSLLPKKAYIYIFLLVIFIEGFGDQYYDFRIRDTYKPLAELESILDGVSEKTDLIAINVNEVHNPTAMYFAHRKGWSTPDYLLADDSFLEDIKSKGCRYVVIVKKLYGDFRLPNSVVYESADFRIYRL